MALDLDFLTHVVNVNWGTGLAVEFTERPDYLTLNHALSMNKVTISFWFRVPKETAEKVRAKPASLWDYRVFFGVVPLVTWGLQQTTSVTEVERYDTGAIDVSGSPIILERIGPTHTAPMQPSCIGVRVAFTPSTTPTLDVHIQTDVHASGKGLAIIQSAFTGDFAGIAVNPPHVGSPIYANIVYTTEDVSYIVTEEPEYLGNSDSNSSGSGAGYPEVTLDEWHHLLVSWDLSSSYTNMSAGGFSKMWCAIDDKNKDGVDLPAMNDTSKMSPNDHMTGMSFRYQGDDTKSVSVSFGSDDVPSDPFHVPGPPSAQQSSDESGGVVAIAPIETVELAELQIFSGVTLDTSVTANRRAFIDFDRDENGNPIRNKEGKRTLKPVDPSQAEELFGKRPAILLHGTTEWQGGKNTGSIGTDADGKEISGGQFHPTGEINEYSDPEIIES